MKGREVMGFAIWMISTWGCAALFLGIGVFAGSREEPMWFWSGSTVPSEKVRDIPEYNEANARMWKIYSVPYWICGPVFYLSEIMAAAILILACLVGTVWLIWRYRQIEKEYVMK